MSARVIYAEKSPTLSTLTGNTSTTPSLHLLVKICFERLRH
jgi:hypothetical protein